MAKSKAAHEERTSSRVCASRSLDTHMQITEASGRTPASYSCTKRKGRRGEGGEAEGKGQGE
eukprot:1570095-Pleurochrysis_carterae.AAC.1